MRKPIEQRIRELEEQKKALQSRLEKQQRAETTRRRMLLGSFVLERLEQEEIGTSNREMEANSSTMAGTRVPGLPQSRC